MLTLGNALVYDNGELMHASVYPGAQQLPNDQQLVCVTVDGQRSITVDIFARLLVDVDGRAVPTWAASVKPGMRVCMGVPDSIPAQRCTVSDDALWDAGVQFAIVNTFVPVELLTYPAAKLNTVLHGFQHTVPEQVGKYRFSNLLAAQFFSMLVTKAKGAYAPVDEVGHSVCMPTAAAEDTPWATVRAAAPWSSGGDDEVYAVPLQKRWTIVNGFWVLAM